MTRPDNRQTAAAHEYFCLHQLNRFGWLRTIDLAALWPGPSASAQRMVQRTLKRLLEQREVLKKALPDRVPVYALSQRGVDRLRDLDATKYDRAVSGADLLRNIGEVRTWRHRCLCNELIIWGQRMTDGSDYPVQWFCEREVLAGRTPSGWGNARFMDRRADGLAIIANTEVLWLEVERSSKPERSHRRLMETIRATADRLRHEGLILSLAVVAASETRYLRRVQEQLAREAQYDPRSKGANLACLMHKGHAQFEPWPENSELPWELTQYQSLLEMKAAHALAVAEDRMNSTLN